MIDFITTLAWFGIVIFGVLACQSVYQHHYLSTEAGKIKQCLAAINGYKLSAKPFLPRLAGFVICLSWIISQ